MMMLLRIVVDYVNLAFWWTAFTLYVSMINAMRFLVPRRIVQQKAIHVFESIGIKVTCRSQGEVPGKYDKDKYSVELVVNDDRFFQHRFGSSVEFGEQYLVRTYLTYLSTHNTHFPPLGYCESSFSH
jgi:hypothetical protein